MDKMTIKNEMVPNPINLFLNTLDYRDSFQTRFRLIILHTTGLAKIKQVIDPCKTSKFKNAALSSDFIIFLSNCQCLLFIDLGSFCAKMKLIGHKYRELSRFQKQSVENRVNTL